MKTARKIAAGVVAGAVAGAALGVLVAPDKGTETRKKIVEKGKNLKDDVKEKFSMHYNNETDQAVDEEEL